MSRPCNECPFVKKTPLEGAPEWLQDVMKAHHLDPNFYHSCHKTDPRADNYCGAKQKRECVGHVQMMLNEHDGTPGRGGVYDSMKQLYETYLRHWLGDKKFNRMRKEYRASHTRRR